MVIHYFVSVEDGKRDNQIKYFDSLIGAINFADRLEHQGHSVTVEIEFQSLQL